MQNRLLRRALIVTTVLVLIVITLFASSVLRLPSAPAAAEPTTAAISSLAVTSTSEPLPTSTVVTPQLDFNRATSTSSNQTPSPAATVTFSPTLFLTPFAAPTETATLPPLTGLGADIELSIVQIHRILGPQGTTILAEITNVTEQPLQNVSLIVTSPDGQRVGDPIPLNLTLLPGETRPGISDNLAAANPVIADWDDLQIHVIGTPSSAQPDRVGYPAMATVGYPNVSISDDSLSFDIVVANDTGFPIAITGQNIAFYNGQGVLLLVVNLGPHDSVGAGGSYVLSGTLPLDTPVSQGYQLADFTDVLVSVNAEISP